MRTDRAPLTTAALLFLAAFPASAQDRPPLPEGPQQQTLARAVMQGPDGRPMGTIAFAETPNGALVHVRLENVPGDGHGLHIHENGTCDGPGEIFDPLGRAHGFLASTGPKMGDLPNVFAGADGRVEADIFTDRIRLDAGASGIFAPGGTSIILHESPDDYLTQPFGRAGLPIACGVIVPTTQP